MKKILVAFFFILFSVTVSAQLTFPSAGGSPTSVPTYQGGVRGKLFIMLPVIDTLNNRATPYPGSLTILPQDTMVKTGIPPIYVSNGVFWGRIGGSSGGGSTIDSITYPTNYLCIWQQGTSTCYAIGLYYQSTAFNSDSTYEYHYNNGVFLDSVWVPKTYIFEGTNMVIRDTTVLINGVPQRGKIFDASGGSDGTMQNAFDNSVTAAELDPLINAGGNEVLMNNANDFVFQTKTEPSSENSLGVLTVHPNTSSFVTQSETVSLSMQQNVLGTGLGTLNFIATGIVSGVQYGQNVIVEPKQITLTGTYNLLTKTKVIIESPDTLLTTPEFIYVSDNDTIKKYPYSGGGGGSVVSVTGDLVDNTDPLNPVIGLGGTHTLSSAGIIDLDGNQLSFGSTSQNRITINPGVVARMSITNPTDGGNGAGLRLSGTNTDAEFNLTTDFNDGTKQGGITGVSDVTSTIITHTADSSIFNGKVKLNTVVSGASTDSVLTWDPNTGAINVISASGLGSGTTSEQPITATGGQTAFTFTDVPASYSDYFIFINNQLALSTTHFTTSGNVVTLLVARSAGDTVIFRRIK